MGIAMTDDAEKRLESDLTQLLSTLDTLRAKLSDKRGHVRPTFAVPIITQIVECIGDFCMNRMELADDVNAVILIAANAEQVEKSAKNFLDQVNRLSASAMITIFSNKGDDPQGLRDTFGTIAESAVKIVEEYVTVVLSFLKSPTMVDTWKEVYGVFVNDLRKVVSDISGLSAS